jgi:hypothetical protein
LADNGSQCVRVRHRLLYGVTCLWCTALARCRRERGWGALGWVAGHCCLHSNLWRYRRSELCSVSSIPARRYLRHLPLSPQSWRGRIGPLVEDANRNQNSMPNLWIPTSSKSCMKQADVSAALEQSLLTVFDSPRSAIVDISVTSSCGAQ